MTIAANVKKLFNTEKIPYLILSHERVYSLENAVDLVGIDKNKVIRTEVLADNLGIVLAVVPLEKKINFYKIKQHLQRNLIVLSEANIHRIFPDCEPGTHPPLGEPYNLQVLLDSSLDELDVVYFRAGSQTSIIKLPIDDFLYLNAKSQKFSFISQEKFCKKVYQTTTNEISEEYNQALQNCVFPELSNTAKKILRLIKQDKDDSNELIKIINSNPQMGEQILNYAKLPLLAGEQAIIKLPDAIEHLGFAKVSHIALSFAASESFNLANDLSINFKNFWRQTLYCATLAECLSRHIANRYSIDPCISYMVGLFHNFGFLLLAQLFPPEFRLLNRWLSIHANSSVTALESRLLGMGNAQHILRGGHAKLGACLLRHWELPEQAWVVAKEHHNPQYQGKYSTYVHIIAITNRILRKYKIGDGMPGEISSNELDFLAISKEQLDDTVSLVMTGANGVENIALALAS